MMFIAVGFAGATFVAKWASDETEDRLEVLLATPLTRSRWVVAGGVAAMLATVVITVMFAAGIGAGVAGTEISATDSMLGTATLGLFTAAIVGIGFAVGGLWRTSLASEIAALVVVGTYLLNLLAPPLGLPDWVHQLALTTHLGQPMMGEWDVTGIVACVVIAVGGIALGAWGMSRRDVAR
jgi:ABC-2 type transport system permease protein